MLDLSAAFNTVHTSRGETRGIFGSSLAFVSGVAGAGAGTPPLSPLLADTPPRSLECWPQGHRKPSPFLLSAHRPPSVFLEKSGKQAGFKSPAQSSLLNTHLPGVLQ